MGPLDFALAGSSLFSGVGGAAESGASAGKSGDLSAMRTKEIVGSALVLGTGVILAIKEKTAWPLFVAAALVGLIVGLHEWHASRNMPVPDTAVINIRSLK